MYTSVHCVLLFLCVQLTLPFCTSETNNFAVSLNDYKFDQRLKRITNDDVFFYTLNNDSRSQASTLGIDYPGTEPWTRPTLQQNKKSRKRRSTSQTKTKSLVKEKKNIHDKEDSAIIQLQKSRRRKRSTKCIVTDDEQVASSVTVTNTEPCTALSEDGRSNPKAKRTRRSRKSTRVAETPSFQRELLTAVDIRSTGQLKSSTLSSTNQLKSSSSINIPPDPVLKTKRKYSRRKRTTNFSQNVDFTMDPNNHVVVYTDGACSGNGQAGATAGFGVYFGENNPLNVAGKVTGRVTNNNAEIQGAIHALKQAKQANIDKVCIKTDSQFMIKCAQEWMPKWRLNGWKKSDGKPVQNQAELQDLAKEMNSMASVKWEFVPGHSNVLGNEKADMMARQAAGERLK